MAEYKTAKRKEIELAARDLLSTAREEKSEKVALFHIKLQLEMLWDKAQLDAIGQKRPVPKISRRNPSAPSV